MRRYEWLTGSMMLGCYLLWAVLAVATQFFAGWILFPVLAVVAAFHTSLQHEALHGHPTRNRLINEGMVFFSVILLIPYRRYRDLHLRHHDDSKLTDPLEDPESFFWPESRCVEMGRPVMALLRFNNTFFGRMLVGPGLAIYGFFRTEWAQVFSGNRSVQKSWALHLLGMVPVVVWITMVAGIPLWQYLLFVSYPAMSLVLVRSFAEHQAAESVGERTVVVETCPFFSLLFLNNNLHIVHHAKPGLAWYALPQLYRERRDSFLAANRHYLFDGYWQIIRNFAFRTKQPVMHPFLARSELPGGLHVPSDNYVKPVK